MNRIKAIADQCNLSVSTVSRALNGYPDVSEKTRERVMAVARANGYLPNAAARSLKMKNTRNLGILYTGKLRHEYYPNIIDAFRHEAEEQSFDVTYLSDHMTLQRQRLSYLEHCRFRAFDGVAILSVDFFDPQVMELAGSDLPLVTVDHGYDQRMCIASDNTEGMRALLTFAIERGHKRCAFIHGHPATVTEQRVLSYYRTMEAHGLPVPRDYLHCVTYGDSAATYRATQALLDHPTPPTCIFFPDDYAAIGGIEAIRGRGLRIPEDISIAGYDGTSAAAWLVPTLTTYRQDGARIGRVLAQALLKQILDPQERPEGFKQLIEGRLVEGQSIGPAPV